MQNIFVGRQSELDTLREGLDEACAGRGSLILLAGEAGIGKTHLARAFAEHARQRGALVLWGRCFEGEWQPPYGPWATALDEIVRIGDVDLLRQELGPAAPTLAQLVPAIRALLPGIADAPSLSPDEGRYRVYDAAVRFLSRVAQRTPVVLVLDDLHWADSDSLQLLRYAARSVGRSRILILGTYRDPELGVTVEHPLMQTLALVRSETGYQDLRLGGLAYAELGDYLAQAAGQALPQVLVQAVYAATDGNPFYTNEVWRHLTEEAKVLHRAGRWSMDSSIDELGIPEGVRQVVGRRLTRLGGEANAILRVAAGLGECSLTVLQGVLGLAEDELLDGLDEALESGLLRVTESTPPLYDFCHGIVRHTVYETLNPDRRLRLHRRIAGTLERAYAGHAHEHAAEIAAQYYACRGLPEAGKGVRYALIAAEQARANYAHGQAAASLRQARDLAPVDQPKLRAQILCQLALAEADAMMLAAARRSLEEAAEALSLADAEPRAQAEFFAEAARKLKDAGADAEAWEPWVERGLDLLSSEAHDLLWAKLALLRNRFGPIASGPLRAAHWLGLDPEAVAIARASGDEDAYARTLEPLEWRTRQETEAVLAIARSWQEPTAIMRALDVVGRDRIYRHGALREGALAYTELLAVAERYGSIPAQAEALSQMTTAHISLGELPSARDTMGRALEMIAALGAQHRLRFMPVALSCLVGYYLEADWPTLATELTHAATHTELGKMYTGVVPAAYAIHSYVRAGNEPEARRLLSALVPVLESVAPTMYLHNVTVHLAAVAVWEMGAAEYAGPLRFLLHGLVVAGLGSAVWGPHALMMARMAALGGDGETAKRCFAQARQWADDRRHRYLAPIIDYDEALALARANASNHEGTPLLDRALAAFRSLQMRGWEQRALSLRQQPAASSVPASAAKSTCPDGLTPRQAEVLCLLAAGMTNKEIAEELVLSVSTVARHIANIYAKIDAHGRADATAYALRHGLDARPPSA
jgi:DNA-binding CsgD family transcriptional regulator